MTNSFNNAGGLYTVDYSDSTPDITRTYDRRGRLKTAIRNGMTTTLTYNDADQPTSESHSGGTLAGLSVTRTYDTSLRLSGVTGLDGTTTLQAASYGYDNAGRLQTVAADTDTVTYAYLSGPA